MQLGIARIVIRVMGTIWEDWCNGLRLQHNIATTLRIDNSGLALISLRFTFYVYGFMATWSNLRPNTSHKSRDCQLLKAINDVLLHARINEISQ